MYICIRALRKSYIILFYLKISLKDENKIHQKVYVNCD